MDTLRPVFAERTDIDVRFLVTRGPSRLASPLVALRALARLVDASLRRQVDLVHVNLGAHGSCYRKIALLAIPRLLKLPYVLHLHGSAFESFWAEAPTVARRRIDRLFLEAAQVVVLGEPWRRLVIGRLPTVASRTVVLQNASPAFEAHVERGDDRAQLLFLGELGARKGSPILIDALSLLKTTKPWRAVIAGEGDAAPILAAVQRYSLGGCVNLPGWVGPSDVQALLATSHILVLPSFEENLPMAVIEAFAAGLAVVATPVGALPDILKHGETGLVVTPGDAEGLADALSTLIDDPALRRRLGAAAQAYHAEHLVLSGYADRLVEVWRAAAHAVSSERPMQECNFKTPLERI
jgi:glycosyltransferase involved in cell wall biosynthesis